MGTPVQPEGSGVTTLGTLKPDSAAEPNRDRWGRPLITPPGGGKPVAYTRVTTLAKTLDSQDALMAWKQRMTLDGASRRPDLVLAAAAHREDKQRMNKLAEQALEAAQAGAKATIGTALHAITEKIDRGDDPGPIPKEYEPDIKAYQAATQGLSVAAIEQFVVLDDVEVAGTADRILDVRRDLRFQLADGVTMNLRGRRLIADVKTGSIDYPMAIAAQLACYSRGLAYDIATGQRSRLGVAETQIDQEWGIVIHLPAGGGVCTLNPIDLRLGWKVVQESLTVRAFRKRKDWFLPIVTDEDMGTPTLDALIARATSRDEAVAIYHQYEDVWTDEHTELMKARLALIEAGAAA